MVKHVVMWKLRGPSVEEKREQAGQVRGALEQLLGKVPGLTRLEVGVGASGDEQADVVLITTHDDWAALQAYQAHPAHVAAAAVVGSVRIERRVLDFELPSSTG